MTGLYRGDRIHSVTFGKRWILGIGWPRDKPEFDGFESDFRFSAMKPFLTIVSGVGMPAGSSGKPELNDRLKA